MEKNSNTQLALELLAEGKNCYYNRNAQEGLQLLEKAKDLFLEQKDYQHYIEANNLTGIIFSTIGNDSMAVEIYLDCYEMAKKIGDHTYCAIALNNIGSRYLDLKQNEKALEYFLKAEVELRESEKKSNNEPSFRKLALNLNIEETYAKLGDYDNALIYLENARPYINEKENQAEYLFSFDVTEVMLMWYMGKKEEAYKNIDKLMEEAADSGNISDYLQDFGCMCKLLEEMEDYDNWKKILGIIDQYVSDVEYTNTKMFAAEMWMKYYKKLGDEDNYKNKCVEHVAIYFERQQDEYVDRTKSLDIKIELRKKEAARKLAVKQSDTDQLTGLYNRKKLKDDIRKIGRRTKTLPKHMYVGILDIDFFKEENDTYGHLKGDECLKEIAEVIRVNVGDSGSTYRFGGDEFIVLLYLDEHDDVQKIACSIRNDLARKAIPNVNSKISSTVTLSAGFKGGIVGKDTSIQNLMDDADKCLYMVKRSGKDGYRVE